MAFAITKTLVSDSARTQVLVTDAEGTYYVISHVEAAFDTGKPETLAFPADEDGGITSYGDVAGGQDVTIDGVLNQLNTTGARKTNEYSESITDESSFLSTLLGAFDDETDSDNA